MYHFDFLSRIFMLAAGIDASISKENSLNVLADISCGEDGQWLGVGHQ